MSSFFRASVEAPAAYVTTHRTIMTVLLISMLISISSSVLTSLPRAKAAPMPVSVTSTLTPTGYDASITNTSLLADYPGQQMNSFFTSGRGSSIPFGTGHNWGPGGPGSQLWDAMNNWVDNSPNSTFCSAVTSITAIRFNFPVTSSADSGAARFKVFAKSPSNPITTPTPIIGVAGNMEVSNTYNPGSSNNIGVIHGVGFRPLYTAPYTATFDVSPTGLSYADVQNHTLVMGYYNNDTAGTTPFTLNGITMDVTYDPTPCAYSIGNRVWNDANNNGLREVGETGVDGVQVELLDNTNAVELTTTTANGGYYCFNGRAPGTYRVRITAPSGYTSSADVGTTPSDSTVDNDDNGVGVSGGQITSGNIILGAASEPTSEADVYGTACQTIDNRANATVDFGIYQTTVPAITYCLGNAVWIDANKNGQLDAGEQRVANNDVYLYTAGNTTSPFAQLQTNAQGEFKFCGLNAASYIVGVRIPNGYGATTEGGDPNSSASTTDSNGTRVASGIVLSKTIVLGASTPGINGSNEVLTIGFGFVLGASILSDTGAQSTSSIAIVPVIAMALLVSAYAGRRGIRYQLHR
jgi:hypothetical protein